MVLSIAQFSAFFAISRFSRFFISATWHPPCINTHLSAENGENEKSARIRNATNTKGLKIWTQVSTQKQTQTRGLFGKEKRRGCMTNDEQIMSNGPANHLGSVRRHAASGRHVTFSQHSDTRASALDYIQCSPAFESLCCYSLRRLRIRHQPLANH